MDFRLFGRVLWRFKFVVLLGVVFALALAVLTVARVSPKGLAYRQSVLWSSTTRLLVTQNGFPEGRLLAIPPVPTPGQPSKLGIAVADPARINALTVLYAELATSDPVRAVMLRDGQIKGKIIATPVSVGDNHLQLPLIDLMAISTSPRAASALAGRAAKALDDYLQGQQQSNSVPKSDRVLVRQVVAPKDPAVFSPRSKTLPVVVFLVVMLATFGLAFLLENLRPRLRDVRETAEPDLKGAPERRTA